MDIDEALKSLAKNRSDERAWIAIYDRFWPFAKALALRLLRLDDLAEDTAQESFFRLLKYCPFEDIQTTGRLRAFLVTVVRHESIKRINELKTRYKNEKSIDWMENVADRDQGPESHSEVTDCIDAAFKRMSENERHIVTLLLQGWSVQDVSKKMDMTPNNVRVIIYRIRHKFRENK